MERLLGEHGTSVRVILVGKTGLDAKLRLETDFEVIRVRSPMEAIGELAASLPGDQPSIVVVGDDAGSVSTNAEVALDFARGVRTVLPSVVILRSGTIAGSAYDGPIGADRPGDEIRQRVRAVVSAVPAEHAAPLGLADRLPAPPVVPPAPHPVPQPVSHPVAQPASHAVPHRMLPPEPPVVEVPASVSSPEIGDEDVARALVRGLDIVPIATGVLRRRLADSSASFTAGGKAERAGEASVAWEGVSYGVLRAASVPSGKLVRAAEWLASWMRLAEQHAALKNAAFTDSLTGAYNRRYFDKFLESAIASARDERRSITVLVFDVDDFKKYNDSFGHDTGDDILRETVRLLKSVVRPTDRVCRIGGDEFAVIFHEPNGPRESGSRHPQTIFDIADRFQRQVSEHKFPKLVDAPGPLTISGGLATFPWDGGTAAELLTRADQLSLESKRLGKNVITIGR